MARARCNNDSLVKMAALEETSALCSIFGSQLSEQRLRVVAFQHHDYSTAWTVVMRPFSMVASTLKARIYIDMLSIPRAP